MNLIANINFRNTTDFQLAYSSQLYGTFFSVFAKVNTTQADDHSYILHDIEFTLINYKGLLNLYIRDTKFKADTKGGEVLLLVQAMSSNNEKALRLDCKDTIFKKGNSTLRISRRLKRMHSNSDNPTALENGVFDEEFYYREGKFDTANLKKVSPKPEEWDEPLSVDKGVWICPYSELQVL